MAVVGKPMKPNNKPWDAAKVAANLPLLGFTKIDGIRTVFSGGVAYSNSLKPLPNKMLQAFAAAHPELDDWDMEIGVGDPTDEFFFKHSHGFAMKADREADFVLYAFDKQGEGTMDYLGRINLLEEQQATLNTPRVQVLPFTVLSTMEDLQAFGDKLLDEGHEGAIYRRADRPYKHGRATPACGGMYKFKSRIDTEVTITEFHEQMENLNPKTTNEMGNSVRSSHQENKVGKGTLGAFTCTGFFEDGRPFTTKVGVFLGFTDEDKQNIWDNRDKFLNEPMKIKYMGVGTDQSPRTPVALGFRDRKDIS